VKYFIPLGEIRWFYFLGLFIKNVDRDFQSSFYGTTLAANHHLGKKSMQVNNENFILKLDFGSIVQWHHGGETLCLLL
jgi:hypothetical protein